MCYFGTAHRWKGTKILPFFKICLTIPTAIKLDTLYINECNSQFVSCKDFPAVSVILLCRKLLKRLQNTYSKQTLQIYLYLDMQIEIAL